MDVDPQSPGSADVEAAKDDGWGPRQLPELDGDAPRLEVLTQELGVALDILEIRRHIGNREELGVRAQDLGAVSLSIGPGRGQGVALR